MLKIKLFFLKFHIFFTKNSYYHTIFCKLKHRIWKIENANFLMFISRNSIILSRYYASKVCKHPPLLKYFSQILYFLKLLKERCNEMFRSLNKIFKTVAFLDIFKTARNLECLVWIQNTFFTFSSWMRRYWFYVKNDFRNFHQIFTFWDLLSQKKWFLRKCLSVCLSVGRVRHNSR